MADLSKLTEDELLEMLGRTEEQKAPIAPFEARSAEIEQDIAGRQDILSTAGPELATAAKGIVMDQKGVSDLAVPAVKTGFGLLQRGEAAIANPLLEIQRGMATGEDRSLKGIIKKGGLRGPAKDIKPISDIVKSITKGLKGEKLGTFYDVSRKAGFNKYISAFIEVGTLAALTGGLSARTPTGKGLKAGEKGAKKLFPRWMGKNFTYNQAVRASKEIDAIRTTLGTAVKQSIDDAVSGAKQINVQAIGDDFLKLTDDVVSKMRNPIYDIKFLKDGVSLDPSVSNMWRVNQLLDDFMTSSSWQEAGKIKQRAIKKLYLKISSEMKKAAPEIRQPFEAYSKYMNDYRLIESSLRNPKGVILEKRLESTLKPGRPRSPQKAWENVSKNSKTVRHVKKSVEAFNKRQAYKKALKTIGFTTLKAGAIAGVGGAGIAGGIAIGKALTGE